MSSTLRGAPGIDFVDVWKKFHRGEHHDSLRDLLPAIARRLTGRERRSTALRADDFWAVSEVSFEVRPGEALGIIGRNGAGKSTTLKLLTKILRPNRGFCDVRGRIGALIEVSAGFHQDLSGRENVFLQGAIMGMPKAQIASKFDAIVEFSGVRDFIDTPVKRYSNGMNARLGFAIAAHLDPDVLIIDEVLSVGDFEFQQRAFERISTLVRTGIPVVVVSHQLDRIASLCTTAILLEHGRIARRGAPNDCIRAYMSLEHQEASRTGVDCAMRLDELAVAGSETVRSGDHVKLLVRGTIDRERASGDEALSIGLRNIETSQPLFWISDLDGLPFRAGGDEFEVEVSLQLNLPRGVYVIDAFVVDRAKDQVVLRGPAIHVQIQGGPSFHGTVQLNAEFAPGVRALPAAAAGIRPAS